MLPSMTQPCSADDHRFTQVAKYDDDDLLIPARRTSLSRETCKVAWRPLRARVAQVSGDSFLLAQGSDGIGSDTPAAQRAMDEAASQGSDDNEQESADGLGAAAYQVNRILQPWPGHGGADGWSCLPCRLTMAAASAPRSSGGACWTRSASSPSRPSLSMSNACCWCCWSPTSSTTSSLPRMPGPCTGESDPAAAVLDVTSCIAAATKQGPVSECCCCLPVAGELQHTELIQSLPCCAGPRSTCSHRPAQTTTCTRHCTPRRSSATSSKVGTTTPSLQHHPPAVARSRPLDLSREPTLDVHLV
jgi:hypothetical protein